MDWIFWLGVLGSICCVVGAALPESIVVRPYHSPKNTFLALGALLMWMYTILGYLYQDATVFFIFLETLVVVASVFMLCAVHERVASILLMLGGLFFVIWSVLVSQGIETLWFISGLTLISLGYVLKGGSAMRYGALVLGSGLVAFFSYLSASWIFFVLNTVFALFSFGYLLQSFRKK